jgi:hypothetical protein
LFHPENRFNVHIKCVSELWFGAVVGGEKGGGGKKKAQSKRFLFCFIFLRASTQLLFPKDGRKTEKQEEDKVEDEKKKKAVRNRIEACNYQ